MAVLKKDSIGLWMTLLICAVLFGPGILADTPSGKSASIRETLIRIASERDGAATHLYVENMQTAEVTVTFEIDLTNLKGTVEFPYTTTLQGKSKVKLFTLSPIDATRGWSWTYTYYSTFGSTNVEHDNSCLYQLPYAPGKSYRVSQGYNGEYSHFGADQFAIDWRMQEGTPIHAARGGILVGVKNDSNIGGDSSKYDWDANYILIRHADGTLGQYVHLKKGGCKLKIGQRVEAGDYLGLSGNTGHSTGPHLHFSVFRAKDGKTRQTVPVRFRTSDDLAVMLVEGRSYKASGTATSSLLAGTRGARQAEFRAAASQADAEPLSAAVGKAVGR
jgi:murein DD-endopeptidase MepM/ murein hydrolase activator NlpD